MEVCEMAKLTQAVERKAFSAAIDVALKHINKDREKGLLQIVDLAQKFMGDNFQAAAYDGARKMIQNPDQKWMRYVNRLLDETDPHVAKMTALNLGYQAAFCGTKTIRKMREVHNCNIPWLILMDPTSACNLHCTGCWAAEYGNKLNLTFDELDSIVTQGKELGIYFYMFTGGEPLVRKADLIKLCEKHNECAFHSYTNGTLVDQKFCDDMKRVGNLSLSISLEGFEDTNDFRRGNGVFDKVIAAMDLLHENGAEKVYWMPIPDEKTGSSLRMTDQTFTDKSGNTNRCYETRIKVVIDADEYEMQSPVMNGSNPVKDNSMSQQRVWNSMCRSFVKCVAIHTGLGFDLWLKEEMQPFGNAIPECEEKASAAQIMTIKDLCNKHKINAEYWLKTNNSTWDTLSAANAGNMLLAIKSKYGDE